MIYRLITLLFVLCFAIQVHADEHHANRKYLSSESVRIEKDSIFVFLNNQWVQTSTLHTDSRGIYVDEIKLVPWYCSNCNRWTTGWFCCEYCGALPDKG
jgi:hypothetical protein